jgi:hypothetical protein
MAGLQVFFLWRLYQALSTNVKSRKKRVFKGVRGFEKCFHLLFPGKKKPLQITDIQGFVFS